MPIPGAGDSVRAFFGAGSGLAVGGVKQGIDKFATPAFAQAAGGAGAAGGLISFVPIILISIPIAIGNFFLAKRIDGASPVLWLILSLIPVVNFVFWYYIAYKVVFSVLDHLRAIRSEGERRT